MTANKPANIGGLLLAAGSSSRLGQPKQLIVFDGKTIIRRAAESILETDCSPVVVVLGAEIDLCKAELDGLPVTICTNSEWLAGMGRSISVGLEKLINIRNDLDAVLITLCDQPHVTSQHLADIITEFQTSNASIVAAKYNDTIGVPALFPREIFPELLSLNSDKGARQIIRDHSGSVQTVIIEAAIFDIDTESDLLGLMTKN